MRLKHFLFWLPLGRRPARASPPLLGIDTEFAPEGECDPLDDGILADRIAAMPALTREVFLLRTVDQMSLDEISRHLAIARWRVKSHMRRAVNRLAARTDA
jgi:DNA-directed RNA polymerase specialized sigma24 family protein